MPQVYEAMYCMWESGTPTSLTAVSMAEPSLFGPPITTPLPATEGTQRSRDSGVPVMPPVAMMTPRRTRQLTTLSPRPHWTPTTRLAFSSNQKRVTGME